MSSTVRAAAGAAVPSLAGSPADRSPAARPAPSPIAPASAGGAARGALPACFFLNNFNFPSGMGPSTRPCQPSLCCCLKCCPHRSPHPCFGALRHCPPAPFPHVRAMHFAVSMFSGVKRRHSSPASDAPAPCWTPAGTGSADGTPAALPASSSSSPARPGAGGDSPRFLPLRDGGCGCPEAPGSPSPAPGSPPPARGRLPGGSPPDACCPAGALGGADGAAEALEAAPPPPSPLPADPAARPPACPRGAVGGAGGVPDGPAPALPPAPPGDPAAARPPPPPRGPALRTYANT